MSYLIDCKSVSKTFNGEQFGVKALKDVSFTLNEGDRLGILGLNGAGKSTLLNIIGGFIKPSSGSISLYEEVTSLSGFDSLLNPDLTGEENAKLQLKILGLKSYKEQDLIQEIDQFSELGIALKRPVKTYSSGMMLRLVFGIFSVSNPKLLLLDEVLSTGDYLFQRKVKKLLNEKINETSGLIITSHVLSDIYQYCNKCLVLDKGEVQFYGNVEDGLSYYQSIRSAKEVDENNYLKFKNSSITPSTIKVSTEVKLTFQYEQKIPGYIDAVLSLSKAGNKIFTSCILYDSNYINTQSEVGSYELEVIIPKHLLNIGKYSVSLDFGNGEQDILKLENILEFNVFPDEWEKDKLWNQQSIILLRPQLKWSKSIKKVHVN